MKDRLIKRGLGSAKPFFIAAASSKEEALKITDDSFGKTAGLISSEHILDIWQPDIDEEDGITKIYLDHTAGSAVYIPLPYKQLTALLALHGYGVYMPSDLEQLKRTLGKPEGP